MPKGVYKHKAHTQQTKDKIGSSLCGVYTTNKNSSWKGNKVGYKALHDWISKNYGKVGKCENPVCKYPKMSTHNKILFFPKKFEWASISRKPKRDIKDWVQLCVSCHRRYDTRKLKLKDLFSCL